METGFLTAPGAPMKTEALAEAGRSGGGRLSLGGLSLPTSGSAAINALGLFANQTLDAIGSAGHAMRALVAGASFLGLKEISIVADVFSNIFQDTSDLAAAAERIELSSFEEGESTDVVKLRAGLNDLRDLLKRDLSDIKGFIANPPPGGLVEFRGIATQFDKGGTIDGLIEVSLKFIVH
ncbi:hypothetical protein MMC07_006336 [Pseudocyphellaria aurata]|nr:hypothetical protein [Pseudocyphellaria aurata]